MLQPSADSRLTTESAAAWDEVRAKLIASGSEAVPAIREFLARNTNDRWGAGAQRVLGYESPRVAMLDALREIGGPEAEAALAATLGETLIPQEIALLIRDLELVAPGKHREAAVEAARRSLAAEAAVTSAARDVAPLFEVFNRFGGSGVAAELEEAAGRWNYYAAISLAQLPDGAGITALVRLADGTKGSSPSSADAAIRILGSLAGQNEPARSAFLGLVKNNQVSAGAWAQLGPVLAGSQMRFATGVLGAETPLDHGMGAQHVHLSYGNQNFWIGMPGGTSRAEQWEKQLAWLDQLSTVAVNPAAQGAIQEAWRLIHVRLGLLVGGAQ